MLKMTLVAAAVLATAAAGPAAVAAAPNCKAKGANSFVTCTDKIKAKKKARKLPAIQKVRQSSRAEPYSDGSVEF